MSDFRRLLLLLLPALTLSRCSAADEVLEQLDSAESAFHLAIDAAKETLAAEYTKEIAKQAEAGNLNSITRLTTGLQLFRSDGLLMEPELDDEYIVYGKSVKAARDNLAKSYQEAIGPLAKTGQADKVLEIQEKVREFGLRSKLVSLQLTTKPTHCLIHADYKAFVRKAEPTNRLNATFELTPGLSTDGIVRENAAKSGIQGNPSEIVSFRSVSVPGSYLAHGNLELILQPYIEAVDYRRNASFRIQKGLLRASAVSFEAVNFPDHFLWVNQEGRVHLKRRENTEEFARYATFTISGPKFRLW